MEKNVHEYDGKISYRSSNKFSLQEKTTEFEKLLTKIKSPMAKFIINTIINDMTFKPENNFDDKSQIDCTDILVDICIIIKDDKLETFIEEQIGDMHKGMCPQGRTTRLWQCLSSLEN